MARLPVVGPGCCMTQGSEGGGGVLGPSEAVHVYTTDVFLPHHLEIVFLRL